jgi:hypothetical protein
MIPWKRYAVVAGFALAVILIYTMTVREPAKTVQKIRIELDIFSGRQNPSWELTEKEATEMLGRMKNLPSSPLPLIVPGLGYRGFIVSNQDKIEGLPIQIRIYNGTITTTENEFVNYYEDINKIESWLLEQAQKRGYGDIISEEIQNKSI